MKRVLSMFLVLLLLMSSTVAFAQGKGNAKGNNKNQRTSYSEDYSSEIRELESLLKRYHENEQERKWLIKMLTEFRNLIRNDEADSGDEEDFEDYVVYLQGEAFDCEESPVVTYKNMNLPTDLIRDGLGAKLSYDKKTTALTISKADTKIVITFKNKKITVNNKQIKPNILSKPSTSTTLQLIKFIAQTLGYSVELNEDEGVITIEGNGNLAAKKTVWTDSQQSGYNASYGNDENTSTRWCAADGNSNHWWKVDLGNSYDLKSTEIKWEFNQKYYKYKIEVSPDDINWTLAVDKTGNSSNSQTQKDSFTTNSTRYIRVTVTGLDYGCWASFYEFKAYGNLHVTDTMAPYIPEKLTAYTVSASQINLAWNPAADNQKVAGYKVFRNGSQIGTVTSGTSYCDYGLAAGTGYSYAVSAYDAAGNNSLLSAAIPAFTLANANSGNGLKAEYYNNQDLTDLKVTCVDTKIDFDWGKNAPKPSMDQDSFSIRWTGQILPLYTQEYTFRTVADDGVRLWINGNKIIDNWTAHSATENSGKIQLIAGQKADIKLEYFDYTSDASVKLYWENASMSKQIIPQSQLYCDATDTQAPTTPNSLSAYAASANQINVSWSGATDNFGVTGYKVYRNGSYIASVTSGTSYADSGLAANTTYSYAVVAYDAAGNNSPMSSTITASTSANIGNGNGLLGEYYDNMDLTGMKMSRFDPKVNFDWDNKSPAASIAKETFSVRWTGQIMPLFSEEYTFYTKSDDGVRLWVNGSKIIDNWTDHGATENSAKILLNAGQKVDIKLEYYQNTGDATIKLLWSSRSQGKELIPQSQLFSNMTDTLAPSVPAGLTATAASATQINLSWSPSTDSFGVAGYKVFRNGNYIAAVTNGTSYADTGLSAGTTYSYTVLAYDSAGNQSALSGALSAATAATAGNGNGLGGEYYDGKDFGSLKMARVDAKVDFNWSSGAPSAALGNDAYSVRWTGQVLPLYSEEYTFITYSDDGIRLWVNGAKIIDNWTDHAATENEGKIRLTAGQKADIKLEYFQGNGDAVAKLSWQSPSQTKQIVPQSQLFTSLADNTAPTVPTGLTATAASTTQINLSWAPATDVFGVAGYKVFRNGTQISLVINDTKYSDTGLTPGTTYTYTVSAYDAANNYSAQCAGVNGTTKSNALVTVNDNVTGTGLNQFNYSDDWNYGSQGGAYMDDNHWSSTTDAYYTVLFSGTQFKLYGAKDPGHGIAAVYIDGVLQGNIDFYASSRTDNILNYTSPVLTRGQHTLKVKVTGTKNSSATNYYVPADRVEIIDN